MCLEKGMRSQRGCTVQGFSPLDLLPADLRAAKNPKRRKRRRKRTRRRRNIRRRRRRTSIPRRILPLHPPILPQIGIRGNWDGMGHHQWKTGATCTRPPSERTAGISHLPKIPFPPPESPCPRRQQRRKTQQHSEASRHGGRRRRDTESSASSGSSPGRPRSRSRDGRGHHPSPRRKGRKRSRSRSPTARGVRQRHDTDSED